jgi:hypothetical protein
VRDCSQQNSHYKNTHEKYGEEVFIISISLDITPENEEARVQYYVAFTEASIVYDINLKR